jgi:hypothetical protein
MRCSNGSLGNGVVAGCRRRGSAEHAKSAAFPGWRAPLLSTTPDTASLGASLWSLKTCYLRLLLASILRTARSVLCYKKSLESNIRRLSLKHTLTNNAKHSMHTP